MERGVRDFEQLQERDADLPARRIGMMLLAALTVVGLIFAMGVVVGEAAKQDPAEPDDPLSALSAGSGLSTSEKPAPGAVNVDPTQLTFPDALSDRDPRPEVIAALQAAKEEEAALAAHDDAAKETDELSTRMPAAMAAVPGGERRTPMTGQDPLVTGSLPDREDVERAPAGEEGTFTLHVISYDNGKHARDFADALRDRGHKAFVTRAEVPDRGVMWRVRIGPFPWRHLAERYRDKFERQEHMNTYIVRRKDENE